MLKVGLFSSFKAQLSTRGSIYKTKKEKDVKQFYFMILFALSLTSTLQAAGPETPISTEVPSLEKYVNKEKNYSIEYPSDWKKSDVPRLDIVLFAPQKSKEVESYASMNIVAEKVGPEITLNQFYTESTSNLKEALSNVQIEKIGESQMNGVPSKWTLYVHEMKNIKFKVLQYFIVTNETVYLMTFSSTTDTFGDYQKDFEKIAASFHLTK